MHPAAARTCAGLVALAVLAGAASPARAEHATATVVETRALTELRDFTGWLAENDANGFIGEVGWPGGSDADRWNHLAEAWLDEADAAGLWVTGWATGEWWPHEYPLAMYTAVGTSVDTPRTQAPVLEAHAGRRGRGMNVAGAEFAAPSTQPESTFSNENPGAYEVAYHYDSPETFRFLAQRGLRLVRLPFRWERLQPRLGERLDKNELRRLSAAVAAAGDAGLKVVLDMHNYGGYYLERDGVGLRRAIGSRACSVADFVDVWRRLSSRFGTNASVVGYGLMNEPVGIAPTSTLSPSQRWERITQRVLSRVRARGDNSTILVPGYQWSGVQSWRNNHPDGWIEDPANRFRYEGHHYWDADHSGTYKLTYDEEVAAHSRAD